MNAGKPMAVVAAYGIKLTHRPGPRLDIARAFFDTQFEASKLEQLKPYFTYYIEELELLQSGISEQSWQSADLACVTYEDIFHIVDTLRKNPTSKRLDLRTALKPHFTSSSDVGLDRAINLVIRLWLMVNIQDTEFETLRHEATCVQWNDDSTLQEFFAELFPRSPWQVTARASRLGPYFTAAFMHRVCDLKIEWTTSLSDHLRLDRQRRALKIFPYKCHLQAMMNDNNKGDRTNSILPPTLLHETKLSLDLLFPFWDAQTVKLLERSNQHFHELGPFEATRSLSLMDFDHWRDRLLELHEEVFLSPPVSWAQLWRDKRNPQQFWTFWIALVILVLTVVSTVTGVVQAWASIKSLS